MPPNVKEVYKGFIKVGTVQFKRRPPELIFYVELDYPEKQRGRIVEVRFPHEMLVHAHVADIIDAMREQGVYLRDTMG